MSAQSSASRSLLSSSPAFTVYAGEEGYYSNPSGSCSLSSSPNTYSPPKSTFTPDDAQWNISLLALHYEGLPVYRSRSSTPLSHPDLSTEDASACEPDRRPLSHYEPLPTRTSPSETPVALLTQSGYSVNFTSLLSDRLLAQTRTVAGAVADTSSNSTKPEDDVSQTASSSR